MSTSEQTDLSDFIKSIHKKLREEAKLLGTEKAWKHHCEDQQNLEKYAKTMQDLAVNHWDKNSKDNSKVISRVSWVYDACKQYFEDIRRYQNKEVKIANEYLGEDINNTLVIPSDFTQRTFELLDVGSCYNPFRQFDIFSVLPIDIAPANTEVLKCDFLDVEICEKLLIENGVVKQLKTHSYDVIVFSLLLEYLPSTNQRLKCCLNAYNLLKYEGILIIITPDSNHVGSNAKVIKSWRYVLAKHGFTRVKYEKLPYLHCMVFRKALLKEVAQRWAELHASEAFFEEIYIPQDFRNDHRKKSDSSVDHAG